ncbi:MAG: hypothetical protein ACE1ZU_06585 [bacterium]
MSDWVGALLLALFAAMLVYEWREGVVLLRWWQRFAICFFLVWGFLIA